MRKLTQYNGRLIHTDGRPTVQLIDPNDNAHRRFQYRLTVFGVLWSVDGLVVERRVLAHDGSPFDDTGSPWEIVQIPYSGLYHPISDPLCLAG